MFLGILLVLLNQIKVDEIVSRDLDSHIPFDVVDEATSLYLVVQFPFPGFRLLVELKFKEKNVT